MAIRRSSRAIGTPNPLPTMLEVNDETGEASLYLNNFGGVFGRVLIATSDNVGNDWTVNNTFRRNWNRNQGDNLNTTEFEDLFNTDPGLRKILNNDRASLINTHSSDDVKKALKEAGVPGIKDPTTGTTTSDTTEVSSTASNSSNQGDTTTTSSRGIVAKEGSGMPKGILKYPSDMSARMNKLKIQIIEYKPKGVSPTTGSFQSPERPDGKTLTTILLPIPGGIQDQNQVSWSRGDMNALQQAAAEFGVGFIEEGPEGASQRAQDIVNRIKYNKKGLQKLVANALAGGASGLGAQLLSRREGAIINPNAELLFNGPTMRNFGFSFNMSARSKDDADEIKLIIRALKQGMSVRRSESGLFLQSPNVFKLEYVTGSSDINPHLNKFKLCAMTGLNVNYTPNQTFMAFENNMPVAYQVDIQFTELEPIFNDDYKDDNSIGF